MATLADNLGPNGGQRRVSIRDVADTAGVSHQTVSRVINEHPNVSPATRKAVLAAVSSLGFRPNRAARALASGRTSAVTVLTSNTSLYGYASTLGGIEEAARAAHVSVGVAVLESAERWVVDRAVSQLDDPRSGAVIVIGFDLAGARALEALPPGIDYAAAVEPALGRRSKEQRWVWFDDAEASYAATTYLLQLGHRTVHHVSVPSTRPVGDREMGWRRALQDAGAPVPQAVRAGGWDAAAGYGAAPALLAEQDVSAVFCGNDEVAMGLLRAAHDVGRRIPEELSVVGFDDAPNTAFLLPSLTTVRLDFAALGRSAFHQLEINRGGAAPDLPAPALVVRESSGPPTTRSARRAPSRPRAAPPGASRQRTS